MDFVQLEDAQRRAFEQDGFLVVPRALNEETVERLTTAGDRLASSLLTKPRVLDRPEYNHLDRRPGLLREPSFYGLVSHSPIVPLVVQLLSANIHLHSSALIYKQPENPDAPIFRRGWHRDIRIPRDLGHQNLPRVGIKVCYCLTDFHEPDAGMTLMARGSHLRDQPLVIPKGEVDPRGLEVCDVRMSAGDVMLFENRIFHTAAPNRSNRVSKVIMYGYAYRWMKPEVYLDAPDEATLAKADPITHQLLGGYRDVDTPPWALRRWAKRHGLESDYIPWAAESRAP